MPYQSQIAWTDAELDTLAKGIEAGLSAGKIAAQLPERSRSAVIGKVDRLKKKGAFVRGLEKPTTANTAKPAHNHVWRRKPRKQPSARGRQPAQDEAAKKEASAPEQSHVERSEAQDCDHRKRQPKPDLSMPVAIKRSTFTGAFPPRNVPLVDLEARDCRFATGDDHGKHLFCGRPVSAGSSWCAHHLKRVYQS